MSYITKEYWETITTNKVMSAFIVLIIATIIVGSMSISKYDEISFLEGLLIEAHGMLLDILIIGVFILWLNRLGERRMEMQRYKNEIDDFRHWESDEAKFRIVGNIKRLKRLKISTIDLSYCTLNKANLQNANLQGANLQCAILFEADLRDANLQGADLQDAIFEAVNLRGARFQSTDLLSAKLQGAKFQSVSLLDAVFRDANLRGVNFQRADLREANLQGANLQGADLQDANFEDANLRRANFRSAEFQDANLQGADLQDANLRNTYITIEQIAKVKTLYEAKIDDELRKQIEENYPQLLTKPDWLEEEDE